MQIINFMVQIQATGPTLDYRYMWVQEPVKFEDALGRILPIPSEYNWEVSFSHPMGQIKLMSDQNSRNSKQLFLLNSVQVQAMAKSSLGSMNSLAVPKMRPPCRETLLQTQA